MLIALPRLRLAAEMARLFDEDHSKCANPREFVSRRVNLDTVSLLGAMRCRGGLL